MMRQESAGYPLFGANRAVGVASGEFYQNAGNSPGMPARSPFATMALISQDGGLNI
jgi:hypothetical protein